MTGARDDDDVAAFYDAWAADYDAAFADWPAAVRHHGGQLAVALADREVMPGAAVLDCTCGIGTQAIGLALLGYRVWGTDLSGAEVERARAEAAAFRVDVPVAVADLLDPDARPFPQPFDAVVSANSLTHFHDETTLHRAVAAMVGMVRPGGVVAITNRDYDDVVTSRPASTALQVSVRDGVRRVSFQLWDWTADGRSYVMEDVLLTEAVPPDGTSRSEWTTRSRRTHLRAWLRADIEGALERAGCVEPQWMHPGHQPIVTARRA